jgi:hypothetical protein
MSDITTLFGYRNNDVTNKCILITFTGIEQYTYISNIFTIELKDTTLDITKLPAFAKGSARA